MARWPSGLRAITRNIRVMPPHHAPTLHHAYAVANPLGNTYSSGCVAVIDRHAVAFGHASDLQRDYPDALAVHHGHVLLTPPHINTHTHLSLHAIGPQPHDPTRQTFIDWIMAIGPLLQHALDAQSATIARAAAHAATLAQQSAVEAVGDITLRQDAIETFHAVAATGIHGTCFLELLAASEQTLPVQLQRLEQLKELSSKRHHMQLGLQPHAPYSTLPALYDAVVVVASQLRLPLSTHLAETLDEATFIATATGPFRDFLQLLGLWSDATVGHYNHNLSPVRWLEPILRRAPSDQPWLLAHCNHVSDDDIATLAQCNASVAYCPIASEYFGHTRHRYRDMIDAGINVCLGTDSILCQSPNNPQPYNLLAAMRRLYDRDRTDPALLLRMATTHGRRALQLQTHPTLLASIPLDVNDDTPPLIQMLTSQHPATAVVL